MLKFQNKQFSRYFDLYNYLFTTNQLQRFGELLPHSDLFYCKAALQYKFKREFSYKQIKELTKDMPRNSPTKHHKI